MQVLHISVLPDHIHVQHSRTWQQRLKQSPTEKTQFGQYRTEFSLSYQHLLHIFEDTLTFGHTFTPMIHISEMKQIPWQQQARGAQFQGVSSTQPGESAQDPSISTLLRTWNMASEKPRRCYSKFYNRQEFIEKETPMWKIHKTNLGNTTRCHRLLLKVIKNVFNWNPKCILHNLSSFCIAVSRSLSPTKIVSKLQNLESWKCDCLCQVE